MIFEGMIASIVTTIVSKTANMIAEIYDEGIFGLHLVVHVLKKNLSNS